MKRTMMWRRSSASSVKVWWMINDLGPPLRERHKRGLITAFNYIITIGNYLKLVIFFTRRVVQIKNRYDRSWIRTVKKQPAFWTRN